ncbi:uncharacterized protein EDB91DRAFT_1080391 [Suillus paluster]|uniref:uncharacterized protein n=1 Tax=Suillus paluster TaxID=48578 RepID=UPI001B85FA4B|nr:uncharacterized protein EDB91DRAFT_1080391 [Suillus paluster]KAG1745491.1 hypothetical protein EDB91DRAFT_1080391 [Suillus paluster]
MWRGEVVTKIGCVLHKPAVNADNVTANDTQTTKLASLDNLFESVNHVRCFNHTLQLSAKALLKPFSSESSAASTSEANDDVDDDEPPLMLDDDSEVEEVDLTSELDDADDNIDELEMLSQANHEKMLDDTAAVKETIAKQYKKATLFFSQDSATIAAMIPAMDKLDSKLNQQTKKAYHPAVVSAMQLAKNKMDRYWKITDLSNSYILA